MQIIAFGIKLLQGILENIKKLVSKIASLLWAISRVFISYKYFFHLLLFLSASVYLFGKEPAAWLPFLVGFTTLSWLIISAKNILPKDEKTDRAIKKVFASLILLWSFFLSFQFLNHMDNKFIIDYNPFKYWKDPSLSIEFAISIIEALSSIFLYSLLMDISMSFGAVLSYICKWAFKEFNKDLE